MSTYFESFPQSLLVLAMLLAALPPGVAQSRPATDIAERLQPYLKRHELAGAVALVASRGEVLAHEAVGFADVAEKRPMRMDSVFWIASISKPITATAVMLLVDEGRLNLDEAVEKYLPGFKPKIMDVSADGTRVVLRSPRNPITLRFLLSHQSGLAGSGLETERVKPDAFPLALRVQSYALEPLKFEPGTDTLYANAGINTAARVVEVVSRMPFEEFLQQRLFGPLGMHDTGFWLTEEQHTRLAKAYKQSAAKDGFEEISTGMSAPYTDRKNRYPVPGGGLFSTAADLAAFGRMILNGGMHGGSRILSAAAIAEMTRKQEGGSEEGYSLGWNVSADGSFRKGGFLGTKLSIDSAHGLITVWLVQGTGGKSFTEFQDFVRAEFWKKAM